MLVNSVVGGMEGWMDEGKAAPRRVGFIYTEPSTLSPSLSLSLADGQKTNRCFEKKKER